MFLRRCDIIPARRRGRLPTRGNRMVQRLLFLSVLFATLSVACNDDTTSSESPNSESPCGPNYHAPVMPERNGDRVSIKQGVWGDVWFWQGDFMPVCETGTVQAVGREVRIHAPTTWNDVVHSGSGAFYSKVNTPLIATVWSDSDGFFQAALPVGTYSVFVVEQDSLLYANWFDSQGRIYPVEVRPDSVTAIRFDITYKKAF